MHLFYLEVKKNDRYLSFYGKIQNPNFESLLDENISSNLRI